MLQRLTIEDYALIPRAAIDFHRGATVFTGETGSGKTMVLGALAFVLGERANADAVPRGRRRATVTLEFEAGAEMRARFGAAGFGLDDDELPSISRELTEAGKSSIRFNGRAASASQVRELAGTAVDFVGQHEAQRLLSPSYHLELLDRYAGERALRLRDRVRDLYRRTTGLAQALESLTFDEQRARDGLAYAQFALQEIESTAPQPLEDERLAKRRRFLDGAGKAALALEAARDALAGDRGAAENLGAASAAVRQLRDIAPHFGDMAAECDSLQSAVGDLVVRIARDLEDTDFDPAELDRIDARLDALEALKRKYGGSLASALQAAQAFRATVDVSGNAAERRAEMQNELDSARRDLTTAAGDLTKVRRAAADRLRKAVHAELADLGLASGTFAIAFEPLGEPGPGGAERVEFTFAANKGEGERSLNRVASGGELSRLLLALVVALAAHQEPSALVFDEIDSGVGGATAWAVGIRLGRLARANQVVCVTHLAQIACWADAHYVLEKRETREGAAIEVRAAETARERAEEVARMLSGETHDTAMKHAQMLLHRTAEHRREATSAED